MGFINDDFMLKSKSSKKLYEMVCDLPIIDYHCHLSPKMIALDYKFKNAYDLFLGGDHYKWRQMRTNGIDEKFITGDGEDFEKFNAFAKTMPYLIGNPLYHWTHLELKRYFDIDEVLSEKNAKDVWDRCNLCLSEDSFSAQSLIKRSNVEVVCTTDDPMDTLNYHEQLSSFSTKILPTFRPDKAVEIGKDTFIPYMKANNIESYGQLERWLRDRIAYFAAHGCKLSDHAFESVPYAEGNAEQIFEKKLSGAILTPFEIDVFRTAVMRICAEEYTRHGFAMQLHIGALRNNNTRMFNLLGPDTGFDSIADLPIAESLSRLLNCLEYDGILPKTILYTLNPKDNYVLGTMLGNFQKAPTPSKIQFGSGWWFNDQRDGMVMQMTTLANLGMLSRFVGMLTDSRSFVSYPRHEYFRRIMCNLIGSWVDDGEYPDDRDTLKEIVQSIAYYNAKNYFSF